MMTAEVFGIEASNNLCQLTDTFGGFLPTVLQLPAIALASYLFDRSHCWYAAFIKIILLVQETGFHHWKRHATSRTPWQAYQ